jgi:hypothetical protein
VTLAPDEWDDRLRRALLLDNLPRRFSGRPTTTITEIRVRKTYQETTIGVVFTDDRRPDETFGYAWSAGMCLRGMYDIAADDPELVVSMLWANLVEASRNGKIAESPPSLGTVAWIDSSQGFGAAHINAEHSWSEQDIRDTQAALSYSDSQSAIDQQESSWVFRKRIDGRVRTVVVNLGKLDPEGIPLGLITSFAE